MLDLLNDTFKLTLDKHFFDSNLSQAEIEAQTEYQLLSSADGSFNRRSKIGLECETIPEGSQNITHFAPSLFPSP